MKRYLIWFDVAEKYVPVMARGNNIDAAQLEARKRLPTILMHLTGAICDVEKTPGDGGLPIYEVPIVSSNQLPSKPARPAV